MNRVFKRCLLMGGLFILVLSGCGKSEKATTSPYLNQIQITISDHPLSERSHTYTVMLKNAKGESVNVNSVELKLRMQGMDHRVGKILKKEANGVYKGKIELPMESSWDKTITLKKGGHVRIVSGSSIKNNE